MDRFESMAAFVAVVEAGGFTAASRRTRMPLASVSRKVSELETLLNVVLIARSGRGIKLTESGERYYADCRRLLDDLGEVERAASGEYVVPRGDLVVTAPVVFGRLHLTPIAVEFLDECPEAICACAFATTLPIWPRKRSTSRSASADCPTAA
jgi:DNA-binding transcriptional LysR family regulator